MKSVRLSKFSREEILNSVMAEFEKSYWAPLGFESVAEYVRAYEAAYDEAMNAIWDKCYGHLDLSGVPVYLLSDSNFSVANERNETRAHGMTCKPGKRTAGVDILLTLEEWDSFFEEYHRLKALESPWATELKTFRNEVWTTLESVNTTGQLVELWPSAEAYIPPHLADPERGINLPALHISRLDEKLRGAK